MEEAPRDWRVVDSSTTASRVAPQPLFARAPLLIAGALVIASICAAFALATSAGSAREVAIDVAQSPERTADAPVVVDVAGGVARPGVYRLAPGTRVADAIAAAGGFGPTVDAAATAESLNLAAPLKDGEKIAVPQRGTSVAAAPSSRASTSGVRGGRIDLNTASQSELESLPGIGPVTATKIIEARSQAPFRSLDELTARKVIGASTLDKIRSLVSLGG